MFFSQGIAYKSSNPQPYQTGSHYEFAVIGSALYRDVRKPYKYARFVPILRNSKSAQYHLVSPGLASGLYQQAILRWDA